MGAGRLEDRHLHKAPILAEVITGSSTKGELISSTPRRAGCFL